MEAGILPSRQELLSRIELVCELDSSLIAVTGDAGIGKSALLEFFIEHHCLDRNKCFVQATKDHSAHQLREKLLVQLLPGCAYDPHLSLAQNIDGAHLPDPLNVIIIIDSAEFAASEIFQDLLALLKGHNGHQFSVIFAQPRDAERISQLNAGRGLIEIHLEPLSKAESRMLLAFYYQTMIDSDRAQVQKFIDRCQGLPAKLLKFEDNTAASATSGKLSKKLLVTSSVVVLLVAIMAVAAWYFIPKELMQETAQDQADMQTDKPIQDPLPEQTNSVTQSDSESVIAKASVNTETKSDAPQKVAEKTDDKSELGALLVQNWSDSVNKAKTVKKTVDKTPVNATVAVSDELAPPAPAPAEQQSEVLPADDTPLLTVDDTRTPSQDNPVNLAVTEQQAQQQVQTKDGKMDNQWFLSQPASDTVIQLAGVSNTQVLETFLVEHQLKSTAHTYQSVRNGNPWYVVTTKAYKTPDEARQAITGLSASLRSTQPWVKSIRAIQSEIINANKKN